MAVGGRSGMGGRGVCWGFTGRKFACLKDITAGWEGLAADMLVGGVITSAVITGRYGC